MPQGNRPVHASIVRVALLALVSCLAICLVWSSQAPAAGDGGGLYPFDGAQKTKRHGKAKKHKRHGKKKRLQRKQRLDRSRLVSRSRSQAPPTAPGAPLALPSRPAEGEEVAPYSKNPSELRPYYVCPPATETRATCMTVATPNPEKLERRGLMVPLFEGSGEKGGLSPADIQDAYNLPAAGGEGVTVAITVAYHNPKLESDLAVYRAKYGLPPCTTANGCLKRVNQKGEEKNYPSSDPNWAWEASIDVDMVSAVCPKCKILVVEANNAFSESLDKAVETAASFGPDAISNSWSSGGEGPSDPSSNSYYDHPGIPVLFASGNWGHKPSYAATSPDVIAVGGTDLKKAENARGWSETAWENAGSGCSRFQEKPAWQKDIGCDKRTVTDVSAVASTSTPVSVYDTSGFGGTGWLTVGGTSVATPIVAGIEALSSSAFRAAGPSAFHRIGQAGGLFDVTAETSEAAGCELYLCRARPGYDGPTGWGTPNGPLSAPVAVTEAPLVASTSKATLRGAVLPGGVETEYFFEYGKTTSYGTKLPGPEKAGSGNEYVEVGEAVEGLQSGTAYHYRIGAVNSKGTFYGLDRTFRTTPPTVTTEEPSGVSGVGATLEATVDPEGSDTIYWFEYGPTSAYGNKLLGHGVELEASSGEEGVSVSVDLMSMRSYHYRVVAKSEAGISYGEDQEFSTSWSEWRAKPLSSSEGDGDIESIDCAQANSCMAVGTGFAGVAWVALAEKWDGSAMSPISIPNPSGSKETRLPSVSCTSSSNCVAVGYFEDAEGIVKPLAEKWNGSEWKEMTTPAPAEASMTQLEDVSCVSTQCIAVGQYKILAGQWKSLALLWNGTTWSIQTPASPSSPQYTLLSDVSCTAANACTAVGEFDTTSGSPEALVNRWNGTSWSLQSAAAPEGAMAVFQHVSCTSSTHCTATGETTFHDPVVERWNGTTWSIQAISQLGDFESINDISCLSANACTTAGYSYEEGVSSSVMRDWNGSSWSSLNIEEIEAPVGGQQMSALGTVSCPTATTCVAVGVNGMVPPGGENVTSTDFVEYQAAPSPVVIDSGVEDNTGTEATLSATINPAGLSTTYQFEYGETKAYGSKVPASAIAIGSGLFNVEVDEVVEDLAPGTPYHFRVVATNSQGTTYGGDQKFVAFIPPPTFDFSTGSKGTGSGQFSNPNGVDVDSEGHAWVTDGNRELVQEFGPEGEYLSQFGVSSPGAIAVGPEDHLWILSGIGVKEFNRQGELLSEFSEVGGWEEGEMWCPVDIAIDPEGDIWIPDVCVGWVNEFSPTGEFLGLVGEEGTTPGKLSSPTSIDFDAQGDLWVLDFQRVQQFTAAGEYLSGFGEKGSGNGQFNSATGIAIDSEGGIWVADSGNHRVQQFNSDGDQLTQFGEAGSGAGQFGPLSALAVDAQDDLWVLDPGNYRVQHWLRSKPPAATTEVATGIKASRATLRGAVNPRGAATDYWFEYGKTPSYGSKVPVPAKAAGAGTVGVPVDEVVKGLEPEATYHYRLVAVSAAGTRRGSDQTFTTKAAVFAFGSAGSGPGQFDWPVGIDVDSEGHAWVIDSNRQLVQEFSPAGEYLSQFGAEYLTAIAVDGEDNLWILSGNAVMKFNREGEQIGGFQEVGGWEEGELWCASDIAIDPEGDVWVADVCQSKVNEFSPAGEFLGLFGEEGTEPGQISSAYSLDFDSEGDVWIGEGSRVQEFSPAGEFLASSGEPGSAVCQFGGAQGVAVDSEDNVWAVDASNNRFQKIGPAGECLGVIGAKGSGLGQLKSPQSIAVGPEDEVWVVDFENKRVQVWASPEPPTPTPLPKATTEAATEVKTYANGSYAMAKLSGKVNPTGGATSYYFEYGKTSSYGEKVPVSPQAAGSGEADVAVSEIPGSLATNTTYHYRLTAVKGEAVVHGKDKTFTTPIPPDISSANSKAILSTEATLTGKVNPRGLATTYQFEYGKTTSYGSKAPASPKSVGSGNSFVEVSETLTGLAAGTKYHWQLVATNGPGTRYASGSFTTYKALPSYSFSFGSEGTTNGKLKQPHDVAVDGLGNAYVLDTANHRIQKFNSKGEYVSQFGSKGTGNGQFNSPKGLTYYNGSIWVADTGNHRVQKFNTSGEYLSKFGSFGSGNIQFNAPSGIDTNGSSIYVADTGNNRIQRFNASNNEYTGQFGSAGSGNGQFSAPADVAAAAGGVYVADTGNNRIQKFNGTGSYLSQFGSKGTGNGQFEGPTAVDGDSEGSVFVLDSGNRRVQKFNPEAEFLGKFGSKGTGAGQFETPRGLHVDSEDHVWATDIALHRVLKW